MTRLSLRKLLIAALLLPTAGVAATKPPSNDHGIQDKLKSKGFFALSLLEADPAVREVLARDPAIQAVENERTGNIRTAVATCKGAPACELTPMLWTDEQTIKVAAALRRDYEVSAAMRRAVDALRGSMAYQLFSSQDGPALLASAWTACAHGVNQVIKVYGMGAKPLYPKIDSISLEVSTGSYQQLIHSVVITDSAASPDHPSAFFSASLNVAIDLLMLNHRDEAARFEPVAETINGPAVQAARSIDWSTYSYSTIVVPGEGPADPATPLSALGHKRVALAAAAFHEGKAPFILVSGGFVHPSQTRFAEASEMKLALMQEFAVPESAILVEPFARHTTTNLRNAVRELYRYKIPLSMPMLVVSDPGQISYIASPQLKMRCQEELGYLPFTHVEQVTATQLAVLPDLTSLQQNPMDSLDP